MPASGRNESTDFRNGSQRNGAAGTSRRHRFSPGGSQASELHRHTGSRASSRCRHRWEVMPPTVAEQATEERCDQGRTCSASSDRQPRYPRSGTISDPDCLGGVEGQADRLRVELTRCVSELPLCDSRRLIQADLGRENHYSSDPLPAGTNSSSSDQRLRSTRARTPRSACSSDGPPLPSWLTMLEEFRSAEPLSTASKASLVSTLVPHSLGYLGCLSLLARTSSADHNAPSVAALLP